MDSQLNNNKTQISKVKFFIVILLFGLIGLIISANIFQNDLYNILREKCLDGGQSVECYNPRLLLVISGILPGAIIGFLVFRKLQKSTAFSKKLMTKKIWLIITFAILSLGMVFISYIIGFHSGCAKVVGNWETTHITDDLIISYCYGERSLWLDSVESARGDSN